MSIELKRGSDLQLLPPDAAVAPLLGVFRWFVNDQSGFLAAGAYRGKDDFFQGFCWQDRLAVGGLEGFAQRI